MNLNGLQLQSDLSDTTSLILEIADRHDYINNQKVKLKQLEERLDQLEQKVKFREKIIRELRRSTNCQPQVRIFHKFASTSQLSLNSFCFSFISQSSITVKVNSDDKFTLRFGGDTRKYEMDRLHQTIKDLQSENGCSRLLIMKLEDELLMTRKTESRTVRHMTLVECAFNL